MSPGPPRQEAQLLRITVGASSLFNGWKTEGQHDSGLKGSKDSPKFMSS